MPNKDYCILVAEDNLLIREAIADVISRRGHCILQAADGAEALEAASQHSGPIHALVTDEDMPILSGHALALELKKQRPNLQVVIVSAHHLAPSIAHDALLQKPVSPRMIALTVEHLLRQHYDVA